MKDGRSGILIWHSIKVKGISRDTESRILQILLNTKAGRETEDCATELMDLIDDPKSTEADVIWLIELKEKELGIKPSDPPLN